MNKEKIRRMLTRPSVAPEGLCIQDHPDVATSFYNIGLVFKKMTKKSEARQMFTEAARIRGKVLGADHPLTKKSERLAAQ